MITFEQLINYVGGLQQRYIREHLIPANAILMPHWAFEELKEQTKNQIIVPIPNYIICFMGLEIIPTMEDEFKLITIYKEKNWRTNKMKRALLISIHPEWAEKILNGEKTIEIRTWIPKDYVGWVYVVITKGNTYLFQHTIGKKEWFVAKGNFQGKEYAKQCCFNGKVVFRFWYEKVDKIENLLFGYAILGASQNYLNEMVKKSCLSNNQLEKYLNGKVGYAWHIDDLVIFDKPKELSEFKTVVHYPKNIVQIYLDYKPLKKAPQKCVWVEE